MTTFDYIQKCAELIRVQRKNVEQFGFCAAWNSAYILQYDSVAAYDDSVIATIRHYQTTGWLENDLMPEEALNYIITMTVE